MAEAGDRDPRFDIYDRANSFVDPIAEIYDTEEAAQAILDFLNNREPSERKE